MYFYRLKLCRESRSIPQRVVAQILNIDQRVYSTYETGKRKIPINYLILLAKFYGTSVDYLVGLTNVFKPYRMKENDWFNFNIL